MTAQEALKTYFGYDSFRPGAGHRGVGPLLSGRDALAIMPTGAGKSLCYQIPALLLPGLTLVISPLISLMQDQVESLTQAGVRAAYLNSTLTPAQYARALRNMAEGAYKIVYVAPERLSTEGSALSAKACRFRLVVRRLKRNCVSQWGQDFRPDYLRIAAFVDALASRPVVGAFTATATKAVRADMASLLALQDPVCVTTGFDRPNLYFGVQTPHSKPLALLELLEARRDRCGIVYCATRKAVEEVERSCADNGFRTRYHAGLSEAERRRNQEDFVFDRKSVMVATNAFGMGIDKSNVSFVIHYNMPKNIESYYRGRPAAPGATAAPPTAFCCTARRTCARTAF